MKSRRSLLKGVPVVLALLWLTSLVPAVAGSPDSGGAASPSGSASAPSPQLAQGDFIFFPMQAVYDPMVKEKYFDYIKRFHVCLTNGYDLFKDDELAQIKQAGCQLFVYRWFEGYYANEAIVGHPEVQTLYAEITNHPEWLINPNAPTAGNGAVLPAYFFDWTNPQLRAYYIHFLVSQLDANGYDGVFFDYTGDWGLPLQIMDLWLVKHPEITYNAAGAVFLSELRTAMGNRPVFANAGYKADKAEDNHAYYDKITYDTTESFGTSFTGKDALIYVEGKGMTDAKETYYRPWDGSGGFKDYMESKAVGPVQHQNGTVGFFPIDYVNPFYEPTGANAVVDGSNVPVFRQVPDRAAVHYSYALNKLYNMSSYASDWAGWSGDSNSFQPDDVYFTDLGQPLEASYREAKDTVVRYFQNGFVVVTRTNNTNTNGLPTVGATGTADPVSFAPDPAMVPANATGLFDVFANAGVSGWDAQANRSVQISPVLYPATGSYYPSGRVYMYSR
jgi:hypothetical protein